MRLAADGIHFRYWADFPERAGFSDCPTRRSHGGKSTCLSQKEKLHHCHYSVTLGFANAQWAGSQK
jgi:hypothetical protein